MKYDRKLQFLSVDGINLTNFGDTICEHTIDGDFVEMTKGLQGDTVTLANYGTIDRFRTSQNVYSPIWGQIETWAKFHTALTLQYKDNNTGESKSSTTAYVQTYTPPRDGADGEVTFVCEEVQ